MWRRLWGLVEGGVPVVARVLEKAYTITQSRLIGPTYTMHPPDLTMTPELGSDFGNRDEARDRPAGCPTGTDDLFKLQQDAG